MLHRFKRDGVPVDPKFNDMWYIVSLFSGLDVLFINNYMIV